MEKPVACSDCQHRKGMKKSGPAIGFKARLVKPAASAGRGTWSFLVLPAAASARLPTRGSTTVEGHLNGQPFRAVLEPDGQKSHWLKVDRKLLVAAGAEVGDTVTLEIHPAAQEMEANVPADLRKALAGVPAAKALWKQITPVARRDWILWITSARKPETRARRVANACDMLASGKKRVCCFDRSGFYSKSLGAPEAAEPPDCDQ
jgi:hypothetical protein